MKKLKTILSFSTLLALSNGAALAQPEQLEWLRLDESTAPNSTTKKKSGAKSDKVDYPSSAPSVLTDPAARPGAQTVEPSSTMTVPNWNPPAPQQQRNEIFIAPGTADRLGGLYGGLRAVPGGTFGPAYRQGMGGPMIIQTGPSPSSGNYYQPSTPSGSGSGSYYSSGTPWQTPVISNPGQKDYWGPDGNPFQKKNK